MALDLEQLGRFVARATEIKRLEAEAEVLKSKNNRIQDRLIEGMVESGIEKMTVAGKVVKISSMLWATAPDIVDSRTGEVLAKDWERAVTALANTGHGDIKITRSVHSGTLSARIRQLADTEDGIPEELEENLVIDYRTKLKVS